MSSQLRRCDLGFAEVIRRTAYGRRRGAGRTLGACAVAAGRRWWGVSSSMPGGSSTPARWRQAPGRRCAVARGT